MSVYSQVILQIQALVLSQKLPLNIKKILRHCKWTLLGKLQIIRIITICICITVYNDLSKIIFIGIFHQHLAVNWKYVSKCFLTSICKLRLINIKQYTGIQCQCTSLGIQIYIDIIFLEFFLKCFHNFSLDTNNIIDLCLLLTKLRGLLIQIRLLLIQKSLLLF